MTCSLKISSKHIYENARQFRAEHRKWNDVNCKIKYCVIGLYRENAIEIESEANDSFGGNVYNVTMQITLSIPEFTRNQRNVHCDVLHITPEIVVRLFRSVPDVAIRAYRGLRYSTARFPLDQIRNYVQKR